MGNSLSPLLADLYMDDYISKNLKDVNINNRLLRYVDDLLIVAEMNEEQIKSYVDDLNKIKGTIRFTYEYENNGKINFLDTTLTRNENNKTIESKWFRKTTTADRLLNYESSHPQSIKYNIINNMLTRIIETTKDHDQQQEDIKKLKLMLIKSKYPKDKIEKSIRNIFRSMKNYNNNLSNNENPTIEKQQTKNEEKFLYTITLPYVHNIEILKRKLERLKIKLYFSYPNKISSLVNNKIKPTSKPIVYQIECQCNTIYNGETKVGMINRIHQHEKLINKNNNKQGSEMVQHHINKSYQSKSDTRKAFIIDKEIDFKKRKIKESIYSFINNSINRHEQLDDTWYPILQQEKRRIHKKIRNIKVKSQSVHIMQHQKGQDGDSGTDEET